MLRPPPHTHTLHHFPRRGWQQGGPPRLPPLAHVAGPWRESCEGGLEGPKGQASCRSISALEGRTVKKLALVSPRWRRVQTKVYSAGGGEKEGRRSWRPASSGVPAPERREDREKRWLHNPRASPARRSERSGRRKVGRLVEGRKERTRSRGRRRGKRGASSLGPRAPRKLQSAPRRRESPALAGHGARRVGLFWRGGWVGWGGWVGCGG